MRLSLRLTSPKSLRATTYFYIYFSSKTQNRNFTMARVIPQSVKLVASLNLEVLLGVNKPLDTSVDKH